MLLSNLAKHDSLSRILTLKRPAPSSLSSSKAAIDQLMDAFVKGASGSYNKHADYDYLAYFFADIAKFEAGRKHFVAADAEGVVPLTKLVVFTEQKSHIRRRGVASTIKNCAFDVDSHEELLSSEGVNLLPYILLPLMGSEEYSDEDTEGMLDDVQLLPPDKEREPDMEIMKTHLETLMLLTATRHGRDVLRRVKVYPIIRECHLQVEDEGVREACDRLVQVIMRGEEGEEDPNKLEEGEGSRVEEVVEDEDEMLVEVA